MREPKNSTKKTTVRKLSSVEKALIAKELTVVKMASSGIATVGKTHVGGFLDFLRDQGIVGLAIGLALGAAAGATVKQIVDGLISPIVGFLIGGIDLSQLKWVVVGTGANGKGGLVLSWGVAVSSLITLLLTALVVYIIVRLLRLDKFGKTKK